jgi:hypothetical protein
VPPTDGSAAKRPIRYEAYGSVAFGAYSVRAFYDDGSHEPIMHGSPRQCLETAERLNRELNAATGKTRPE